MSTLMLRDDQHTVCAIRRAELIVANDRDPAGEHLAHLLAWVILRDPSVSDLLQLAIYHPSYEGGPKTALRAICETADSAVPGNLRRLLFWPIAMLGWERFFV